MSRVPFLVLSALLFGCGAAPVPVITDVAIEEVDRGPISVEGEIGGMNEEAVDAAFASLEKPILSCVADGATRIEVLGGAFKVALRVDRAGATRWAYLRESTLGDRETERCVLDLVKRTSWPPPLGGEGLAERSFAVDAGVEPIAWDNHRVSSALKHLRGPVARCNATGKGAFIATAYVKPDGRVGAAGVAPPNELGEEAADCVADAVRHLRFASPGKRSAKVTFEVK